MRCPLFPALMMSLTLAGAGPAAAEPVIVEAAVKPLNVEAPRETRVGRLQWRGTLELTAEDPRFGGYSGLLLGADGRELLAVSDNGTWLRGRLAFDASGRLISFAEAEILPLLDGKGAPIGGKDEGGDAEALARDAAGRILVSFERDHRILAYDSPESAAVELPTGFDLPPGGNEGVEALEILPPGDRLLALVGGREEASGRGLLRENGAWQPLSYRRTRALMPVAATVGEDGTLYLVERAWSLIGGLEIRILRLPSHAVVAGAELAPEELAAMKPPLLVDNFEAIAARVARNGETQLILLSDDNFNPIQRTLLSVFAVVE